MTALYQLSKSGGQYNGLEDYFNSIYDSYRCKIYQNCGMMNSLISQKSSQDTRILELMVKPLFLIPSPEY